MRTPLAVVAALSLLPACLGPRVDASRYFTLPAVETPVAGTSAAVRPAAATPVAVVGLGPVGLATLMIAKGRGAKKLIGVDTQQERVDTAKRLGLVDEAFVANGDTLGQIKELTRGGAQPITLPSGETRAFLQDGDELSIAGHARADGYVAIGFGPCTGMVVG